MKRKYRDINFRHESLTRIEQANKIIDEYDGQKLTARQLYYRFVAAGHIPNTPTSYKNMTSLIADARYAGLIDWDAIEDRGREPDVPADWQDLDALVEAALNSYRLPRWEGQKNYVELWVEKQALAGVLAPIARKWHVTLMVNKGYSSASAMKESADRYMRACWHSKKDFVDLETRFLAAFGGATLTHGTEARQHRKKLTEEFLRRVWKRRPILFYLGDHDPSGEDMVRDIDDRLREFRVWDIEVRKLGITMDQVKKFDPPPNPAKITDSRARAYIEKYGEYSWEVDALPPRELTRIIENAFAEVVDARSMDLVKSLEEDDKKRLREALTHLES